MSVHKALGVLVVAVMFGVILASGVSAGDNPPTSQPTTPPTTQRADETLALDCGDGVKMELVLIPAGTFTMGADDGSDDQKPSHPVTISKPFYMGKYEVTQAQWQAVMDRIPSKFRGDDLPVESVSWDDCQEFCGKLSAKTGKVIRLPTEAEWEYACRAGSTGKYCFGDSKEGLEVYAWFDMNSALATHPVGLKKPNAWGLHDMHGNVWEWCADRDGKYQAESVTNPAGPFSGKRRILRGGSWASGERLCRSAVRLNDSPTSRNSFFGFRVAGAASPEQPEDRSRRAPKPAPQPAGSRPVTIKLSGPAIGLAPYWVKFYVDLPRSVTQGADFLWMDNGVWLTDEPSGVKVYETPGRHEITVLIVTKNNEEYRGSATVAVLESGGQVGEDYVPSTQPTATSQQDSIGSRGRTHVVEPGDTLESISEKYYGERKYWRRILAANRNRLTQPDALPVGMKLLIRR